MKKLVCRLCVAAAASWCAAAWGQAFPSKAIRIVVPFAAGGSVDVLARLVGGKMSESVGQPVLVDNRPGAGAVIGADNVAKSPPDGYSMLLIPNALAIMPAVFRKLPFDATRDFAPVTQLIATELVLVASVKSGVRSVRELVGQAKANPGKLNYGSTGVANPLHLTMELFKTRAGLEIQPIPYKGDAPLNAALMGGEVQFAVLPLSAAQANIRAGKLRALGMTGIKRAASMPDVPTVAEQGFAKFDSGSWQGLFTSSGTPADVVQRLYSESVKALNTPAVLQKLPALGQVPVGSTPQEFTAKFRADVEMFRGIVRDARIPPQD